MSGPEADDDLSVGSNGRAFLIPVAGPPLDLLRLNGLPGGENFGRGTEAQLRVPKEYASVSRKHCEFSSTHGQWTLKDTSSWGTWLNGLKLVQNQLVTLSDGDRIRIAPWTFVFSLTPSRPHGVDLSDDTASAPEVRPVEDSQTQNLAGRIVELLTHSTETVYAARTEKELAEALIDLALSGTGMTTAAVLKFVDASGRVEPIASRMAPGHTGQPLFSSSLVSRARQGEVVELRTEAMSGNIGMSVMKMNLVSAICAPLHITAGSLQGPNPSSGGGAPTPSPTPGERDVVAVLYVDARGTQVNSPLGDVKPAPTTDPLNQTIGAAGGGPATPGPTPGNRPTPPHAAPRPNSSAAGFVLALSRIGSLALTNLKWLEMQLRYKQTQYELNAAALAQSVMMPAREGQVGPFRYRALSRPGQVVSGDFFDVVPLPGRRLAVALGDAEGKGIRASVWMTAALGFLHGQLVADTDPLDAIRRLNAFLSLRNDAEPRSFVTLWLGIFDLDRNTLSYVDCGHGWALSHSPSGSFQRLFDGGGLACGMDCSADYTLSTLPLEPAGRVCIVSDGLTEQWGLRLDPTGKPLRDTWGIAGVQESLAASPDPAHCLERLFRDVADFSGTHQLSDDATALLLTWDE